MKKKLLYFFIFFIIMVIIGITLWYLQINTTSKENKEIRLSDEFIIQRIYYYSGANAISNTTNYQNPEWNIKVYQYTDIAIYLNRLNEVSEKNYITSLAISNIKLEKNNQELYYLNPKWFGNSELNGDNIVKINDKLSYNVINSNNIYNGQNYNIPIYFQDCSNPLTLRFVNNLVDNYKISKDNTLIYNGSLLKEIGLDLDNIKANFSLDIEIITKDGQKRVKNLTINIPLENYETSILEGEFQIEEKENIMF